MYILLKKDNYCEISISKKFTNLFKFKPPYEKDELEVIHYVKKITKPKKKYSVESFIKKFNRVNPKFEIFES